MQEHQFTLVYALPEHETDVDDVVERLGEQGCTDATVGTGRPGRIALAFAREAESMEDAIASAKHAVERAVPGARLMDGPTFP